MRQRVGKAVFVTMDTEARLPNHSARFNAATLCNVDPVANGDIWVDECTRSDRAAVSDRNTE